MTSLYHDLKITVRHLLKSTGFVATAVLMLTLSIGARTAISLIERVLLHSLPLRLWSKHCDLEESWSVE
jgi:hypothetical protein